jgi:aspartyl-tRNA(Asn)/glutamyl-tRNA(Gln) amidotransferase subunit C
MISKKQVEHIAKLARIELTEKEKEKFTQELSSILDYVEQLDKVKTETTQGISQVTGLENIVREDKLPKVKDREVRKKLLKQAPEKKGDYFKVPKILE